jgi:hypothetical protein
VGAAAKEADAKKMVAAAISIFFMVKGFDLN